MSLTKATYALINGAPVNVLDFGAVGDGVADDAAAINNALTYASSSGINMVYMPNATYLIGTSITIPEGVTLKGVGNNSSFNLGGEGEPTKIVKKSTMTTTGVIMSGKRGKLSCIGVYSQPGATGNGIDILANYVTLETVTSNGHGGTGISIGATPSAYANCNAWYLNHITASYNGVDGINIDDRFSTYPQTDANAGVLINADIRFNTNNGLYMGNCFANTLIGVLAEDNGFYGIQLGAQSEKHTIVGGDQDENNVLAEVLNQGKYNTFIGTVGAGFIDDGTFTNYLGWTFTKLNTLTVKDTANVFTTSQSGAPSMLVLQNQSNNGSGNGTAIQFNVPNGGDLVPSINGGKISITQTASANTTNINFYGLDSGVVTHRLVCSPSVFQPVSDNVISCGTSGGRWSVVYSATPTINTSDERQKQDIRSLSEAEKAVANRLKHLVKAFRYKDAVAQKGDKARIHIGVVAQEVKAAFEAEGLDGFDYGILCYDKWDDTFDADGNKVTEANDSFGVRYAELTMFIVGAS